MKIIIFRKTKLSIYIRDWDKYLKQYLKTNLKINFRKLLEILKDCLNFEPKERPNCCSLLQRINELTFDKTVLTEDNKTLEEFQKVLDHQEPKFLKIFFNFISNQINSEPNAKIRIN